MFKLLTLLAFIWSAPALAQNPTCPTRPIGDSSNACASTAFVKTSFPTFACPASQWVRGGTAGAPICSQPAFTDISGDLDLATQVTGTLAVGNGGTGLTAGTSGGIPYFSATNTLASSAALTANLPVIGGGAGVAPSVGTRSGNTTQFVTTTGAQTSGNCVEIDADGNHIASSGACGGGSALIANSFPNVDPTGVADSAAGLNAVINSCPAGGCTIELCGDYSVSTSLVIGNGTNSTPSTKQGVRIVGCGKPNIAQYDGWAGYSSAIATRIKWTGGAGAVINLAGPLRGWGLENLFIDCNNTASTTGIQNISASVGTAESISIRLCTHGILSTTRTFTGAGFHGSASAFNNTYKHFSIYVRNEASAMGMFLDGVYQAAGSIGATTCPCLASTTVSSFEDFYILMGSSTNAQYGVYLRVADTNTFKNIGVLLNPTPGSRGILWDYASNSTLPANNAFHEGYVSSVLGTGTTNTHVNSGTAPTGATTHNWVDRPALINGDTWSTITNTIVTSP